MQVIVFASCRMRRRLHARTFRWHSKRVPVRQWVLSFPHDLRYRLAYDSTLVTKILGIFTKTISASLIQRAREFGAERQAQTGVVSWRFNSRLQFNNQDWNIFHAV
jgi:hypothetical protein